MRTYNIPKEQVCYMRCIISLFARGTHDKAGRRGQGVTNLVVWYRVTRRPEWIGLI
jgi:hypothetical protein